MGKEKKKEGIVEYFLGDIQGSFGLEGMKKILQASFVNWLIPGAGMLMFRMYGRAVVNFILVTLLFVMGWVNHADVNPYFTKQPVTIYHNIKDTGFDISIKVLKQVANYGNLGYCSVLSAYKNSAGEKDPYFTDYRYRFFDIGTAYLVVSGLINILFAFHFADIYIYQKKKREGEQNNG